MLVVQPMSPHRSILDLPPDVLCIIIHHLSLVGIVKSWMSTCRDNRHNTRQLLTMVEARVVQHPKQFVNFIRQLPHLHTLRISWPRFDMKYLLRRIPPTLRALEIVWTRGTRELVADENTTRHRRRYLKYRRHQSGWRSDLCITIYLQDERYRGHCQGMLKDCGLPTAKTIQVAIPNEQAVRVRHRLLAAWNMTQQSITSY